VFWFGRRNAGHDSIMHLPGFEVHDAAHENLLRIAAYEQTFTGTESLNAIGPWSNPDHAVEGSDG
jgi:hypothetical protein